MKKRTIFRLANVVFLTLISLICFVLVGCKAPQTSEPSVKSLLVFNESDFVLLVGEQKRLTADGDNLTWSSSDEKIATVDSDGLVTARALGETEITVKTGEQSASCKVSVTAQYVPVLRIDATNKT